MILHVQPPEMQHGANLKFGLQRKGVVQKLSEVVSGQVTAEWEQWVDTHSPNARNVLRSLFPGLLYKSLLYALTRHDVVVNLRSLLWGCGVRGYPDQWWRPMGCSVLGRGAEPPQFWVLLIWLEPGISHVTWVHYDATMCLPCFVCSILPVLHFLRFDLCVL